MSRTTAAQTWKRLACVGKRDDLVLDSHCGRCGESETHSGWRVGAGQTRRRALHQQRWRRELGRASRRCGAVGSRADGGAVGPEDTGGGNAEGRLPVDRWRRTLGADQPEGSQEIHEVESIAIDPANPKIIYAGTWHLPWKTTDGGEHWTNIKQGIIEDSDVFSIIVDPKEPNVVYRARARESTRARTAARSSRAAFSEKMQGIPSTARRTEC